ncbi:MAG: signal peptidase I [Lachnospiraceae bacterium]|nr:signal peptidase I [Lachnospiraceae bacterium]
MNGNSSVKKYKGFLSYAIIFLVTFILMQTLIGMALIPSGSMEPTLHVGSKYVFSKLSYLFSGPDRGDVIVFDDDGTIYCKRIIALPGETVEIKNESVYINGQKLDEPYAFGNTYAYTSSTYNVPEGEYFFLGDNRENSHDSRLWDYPFLKKEQILGHVLFK